MPKRPRARQALLPDEAVIAAQRQTLPTFSPHDTWQLLEEARALAEAEQLMLDEAVKRTHRSLKAKQVEELTRTMRLEPESPTFWRDAFMRLAEIHHNVGRLVHPWTPNRRSAKSPLNMLLNKILFVQKVDALSKSRSQREVFKLLAKMKLIDGVWQVAKSRNSKDERARADALRQAYHRAKRDIASFRKFAPKPTQAPSGTQARPQVGLLALSAFEMMLYAIEGS